MSSFYQPDLFLDEISVVTKGLIIKEIWAKAILRDKKELEIRGSNTKIRGTIGIIASGTKKVIGIANLTSVIGPLSIEEYKEESQGYHWGSFFNFYLTFTLRNALSYKQNVKRCEINEYQYITIR
ncbi:ASCH domain-containing protein [Oceanobacillus sojae]|uniref:ASCH domain-containing protein n=1 Tax=Oceanobacillus sojae TaxID=582851 RepID=UPI00363606B2